MPARDILTVAEMTAADKATIAGGAPGLVLMQRAGEVPEAEGWKINQDAVGVVFSSADAKEGPVAFAEKREPHWSGT